MIDTFTPDAALLPLLPVDVREAFEPDPYADHVYFAAEESSKGWAVYYEPKPRKTDRGTSYGLRHPILLAGEGLASPEAVTIRVADILNAHWDQGGQS
jgi:hypothetical protein